MSNEQNTTKDNTTTKDNITTEDNTTTENTTTEDNTTTENTTTKDDTATKNTTTEDNTTTESTTTENDTATENTTTEDNTTTENTTTEDNTTADQAKKPAKKKHKKPKIKRPKDKRRARIKKVCSAAIHSRIYRATSEQIYLVNRSIINELHQEYAILGSSGNIYTVTISHSPNCNCPDFKMGNLCKHIIFVYIKVLRLKPSNTYIYQKALLSKELRTIFANATTDPFIMASERVCDKYKMITSEVINDEKRRPIKGDCPICYDPLEEKDSENIVWCQKGCGNNIHRDCYEQWMKSNKRGGTTCVYCRIDWVGVFKSKEGYVNFPNE